MKTLNLISKNAENFYQRSNAGDHNGIYNRMHLTQENKKQTTTAADLYYIYNNIFISKHGKKLDKW